MSYEENMRTITLPAGADLSAKQYYFVKISNGTVVVAGDGEHAIGVLQNKPESGRAANVCVAGVTKVAIGATVAAGAAIASGSTGAGKTAASTNIILGTNLATASAASGDVIPVLFNPRGAAA